MTIVEVQNGAIPDVQEGVLSLGTTIPSFQIFLSDPENPDIFPQTYAVDYSGYFPLMAAVSSLYHRTGAPFELGQVFQMQVGQGETFDQTRENLIFGWAYDEETGELIEINDALGDQLTPILDLETALLAGQIPPDVIYSLQRIGVLGPTTLLTTLKSTRESSKTFGKRLSSKAKRFGLKTLGGLAKWGLIAIIVIIILTVVAVGLQYLIFRLFGMGGNVEVTPSPFDPSDNRYPTCQYTKMPDGSVYHTKNNKGDQEKTAEAPIVTAGTGILYAGIGIGLLAILVGGGLALSKRKPAQRVEFATERRGTT